MNQKHLKTILIISVLWWLFPDFFPGPIDDLIAFMTSVVTGIGMLATKAKTAKDAVNLLTSDTTYQSS